MLTLKNSDFYLISNNLKNHLLMRLECTDSCVNNHETGKQQRKGFKEKTEANIKACFKFPKLRNDLALISLKVRLRKILNISINDECKAESEYELI